MRLIATDLDGTLLGRDGRIPAGNIDALRAAHEEGVRIVIATGRPVRWLDCLGPIADLDPYVVASNGAVLYDLGSARTLRQHSFEIEAVRAIVDAVRAPVPNGIFGLERGDLFGTEPGSPSDHVDFPGVLQLPLEELISRITPVVKVVVYSRRESTDMIASAVRDAVGALATVTSSFTDDRFGMAELSVPGITKARMLGDLCADLSIQPDEVVAFGDMPNDLEMLQWAGLGFVTGDAHPSLRGRFPSVGLCDEAGVGKAILGLLAGR